MVGVKRLINHSCSGDIGDVLKGFLVSVINICFVIIFCNPNQPISIIWSSIVTLISLACYALTTPHVSLSLFSPACTPYEGKRWGRERKERLPCFRLPKILLRRPQSMGSDTSLTGASRSWTDSSGWSWSLPSCALPLASPGTPGPSGGRNRWRWCYLHRRSIWKDTLLFFHLK